MPTHRKELEGWKIVADASELDFDLSGRSVVENEKFERLMSRCISLKKAMPPPPAEVKRTWA
jgi:hypothetical protein